MIEVLLNILRVFLFVSFILFVYMMLTLYRIFKPPENFPSKFLKKQKIKNPSKKRIVLVGDSITHGTVSHSYVKALKRKLGTEKFEFINAGLNGDLTFNVLKRIDDIIRCEPDIVTVLIGTNDALGSYTVESRERYIKLKGAEANDEFWTLERFKENITQIITQLKNEANATIGALSIPIIGEDLMDPVIEHSKAYSKVIKEVSTDLGVHYMPLNELMIEYLNVNPSTPKYKYSKNLGLMIKAIFVHYSGRSWQNIAKKKGHQLLIEFVHLSTKGASFVSDLVEKFIETLR